MVHRRTRSRSRSSSALTRSSRPDHREPAVAELAAPHDRGDAELALACERLRIDHQPRLTRGAQDVVRVQILVHEHLLALRGGELRERLRGGFDQPAGRPFDRFVPSRPASRLEGPRLRRRASGTARPPGSRDEAGGRSPRPSAASGSRVPSSVRCDPGLARSNRNAQRAGSSSSRRTAPLPSQACNAVASCSASRWGNSTFRTASVPSGSVAGIARDEYAVTERLADGERPPLDALVDERRQGSEPCCPTGLVSERLEVLVGHGLEASAGVVALTPSRGSPSSGRGTAGRSPWPSSGRQATRSRSACPRWPRRSAPMRSPC